MQIIPWLSYSVPGIGHLVTLSAEVVASLACLTAAVVSDAGRCRRPAAPSPPLSPQTRKHARTDGLMAGRTEAQIVRASRLNPAGFVCRRSEKCPHPAHLSSQSGGASSQQSIHRVQIHVCIRPEFGPSSGFRRRGGHAHAPAAFLRLADS